MEPLYEEIDLYGILAFNKKYKSFSIVRYLNSINMSRDAIRYISLMLNLEISLSAALTEIIPNRNILSEKFYHSVSGNDRLTDLLLSTCLAISNNRFSIHYNIRVTGFTLRNEVKVDITCTDQNIFHLKMEQVKRMIILLLQQQQ